MVNEEQKSGLIDLRQFTLSELLQAEGDSVLTHSLRRVIEAAEADGGGERVCAFNSAV
jgi:FXSXX-COOH protein